MTPESRCVSLSSISRERTNFLSILFQVFTLLVFGWRFWVFVHSVLQELVLAWLLSSVGFSNLPVVVALCYLE